ncbi:hypothetical protein ACLM5H_13190 [Fredinandcohnia humi]
MGVQDHLSYGENVIFEGRAPELMIDKGSSFGVYTLVITDKKRIIVHDSGGFFGEEKVYFFPASSKLKVQLKDDKVHLVGKTVHYHFDFPLDLITFSKIYKAFGDSYFGIDSTQTQHCLIFSDWDYTYSAEYLIRNQEIIIRFLGSEQKQKSLVIDISEIESLNEDERIDNLLNLKVKVKMADQIVDTIFLYVPHSPNKLKILDLIKNRRSIYNIASSDESVTPAKLQSQLNKESKIDYDVYVLDNQQTLRIVLKSNLQTIISKSKSEIEEFYNHKSKQTVLKIGGNYFFVTPKYKENKRIVQFKSQNIDDFLFIEHIGWISGGLEGQSLSEQRVKIDMAVSSHHIDFLETTSKLVKTGFDIETHEIVKDNNLLLVFGKDSLLCVEIDEKYHYFEYQSLQKLVNPQEYQEQNIIFDKYMVPYHYTQSNIGLALYRENIDQQAKFYSNKSLGAAKVSPDNNYGKSFCRFEIIDEQTSEKVSHYISLKSLGQIIYNAYIDSKSSLLMQKTSKVMYRSMVRQLSDLLIYEYFGQLIALYNGINDFYNKDLKENERTANLVSYLYYGIQSQRKRMDSISVYLPGMLNKIEQDMFKELGKPFDDRYFKELQQKLLGISNQMKGSLLEVENNLTHLGVLIPKRSSKELIDERRKSGYKTTGIGLAVGLGLTALTGGAAFPVLLAPAFMALNTSNSTKMMQLQEDMKTENEQKRNEFYLLKALDLYDHFIETMLPYYVSRVNDAIFECYKKIARIYAPHLDNQYLKEAMFSRIAEIYTYKKLPVDQTNSLSREELLTEIFESIEGSNESVRTFESSLKMPNNLPQLKE